MKLLLTLLLLLPGVSVASPICDVYGEMLQLIRKGYDMGAPKSRYLLQFQDDEYQKIRAGIHMIYRGTTDHMTPDEVRESFIDLCNANSKE